MKTIRTLFTLIGISLLVPAFATNKDLEHDITMVSYEQSWLDRYGTIALKNNTNEEIRNVKFQITYLDMSNKELDYQVFEMKVVIAPGMTKKLDIPAYEHHRYYHYYKTKDEFGHPAFKIRYELKDYSIEEASKSVEERLKEVDVITEEKEIDANKSSYYIHDNRYDTYDTYDSIIFIAILLFVIFLSVGLYVLVAVMAKKRKRSAAVWVLLSIIATPLLMIIILAIIGDNDNEV